MAKDKYHTKDLNGLSFLVTGGSGFIGSNLTAYLLRNGAGKVRVLDNFLTSSEKNIAPFRDNPAFEFVEGDIRDIETCARCCEGMDYVSHQAALGSVPRSVKDPAATHSVNSTGFLNMLVAARDAKVRRFVYASSSSVYGDHPALPKKEEETGNPLSPYAVTKKTNELYARVFADVFKMEIIGLRYFNVFGPNQSPDGPYAAVIPLFMQAAVSGTAPHIDGDGEQTRDFTYVENAVQANVLAMLNDNAESVNKIYNVAVGERVTINELYRLVAGMTGSKVNAIYRPARPGDIRNSLADISLAKKYLGYDPRWKIAEGLKETLTWFRETLIRT